MFPSSRGAKAPGPRHTASRGRPVHLSSGAPLFTFDDSQRILSWNRALEKLTGFLSDDVVGRQCWEILCGHDEGEALVCHAGCSSHRLLREGLPVSPSTLVIRTATGRRRVHLVRMTIEESRQFAAVVLDLGDATGSEEPGGGEAAPSLTSRQLTVLEMLADGKQARAIADELYLSEMTVRNHIRGILRAFGCTSQLAAVAAARRARLV